MDAEKQWHQVKQNYLKQVDEALAKVSHPERQDVLKNVESHLKQKYSEMPTNERTWDNFQAIITQMGPASDYAELFGEEPIKKEKSQSHTVFLIAIGVAVVFVSFIAFIIPLSFLIIKGFNKSDEAGFQKKFFETFVRDPDVIGKWISVDFVRHIDAFEPDSKKWTGDLYLQSLSFYENGKTSGPWQWTKGSLYHPGDNTKAKYEIRYYNDVPYLFMEWMSGDVAIRGQKPRCYVLKKVK